MDKSLFTVKWMKDRIKVVEHTPEWKVNNARRIVDQALNGELPFCWKNVIKMALKSGNDIRNQIQELKILRMHPAISQGYADTITLYLKELRQKEKEHYSWDIETRTKMLSNFNKIKKALLLLIAEGEIESFTLTGTGRLAVNWWTSYTTTELQVIEQGWTYEVFRDRPDPAVNISFSDKVPNLSVEDIIHAAKNSDYLAYGSMVAKKYESQAGNGEWNITDGAGQIIPRYGDRKAGGEYWTVANNNQQYTDADLLTNPRMYRESGRVNQEQWRKERMLNYIRVMFATALLWKGSKVNVYA